MTTQGKADFRQAIAHFQAGEFPAAEQVCRALLAHDARHVDALHMLGMLLEKSDRRDEAIGLLARAAALRPGDPMIANNLGELYRQQNRWPEAVRMFNQAIRLAPNFPEPHYNLAIALKSLERRAEAMAELGRAIELRPGYARAHYNLANLLREEGRVKTAVPHYKKAIELQPGWSDPHLNLGTTYYELGEMREALLHLGEAARLDPTNEDVQVTMGHVYLAQGDVEQAAVHYRRRLTSAPAWTPGHLRVDLLGEIIAPDAEYIRTYQAKVADVLDRLIGNDPPLDLEALHGAGAEPPMSLAYQGRNVLPMVERYATYFGRHIVAGELPRRTGRPKIGIVVTHGHEGVFARCWGGIFSRLSRRRHDVRLVASRPGANILSQMLNVAGEEIVILPEKLPEAAEAVRAAEFDLLHYWEIGTDSTNFFLPFFRPSPVQSHAGGWPVTSGNPHVDFYISHANLESPGAEAHYRETLVKFEHLPMHYERPAEWDRLKPRVRQREQLGLAASDRLYLCTQNLRKYHPDFDAVLEQLLAGDERARLWIIADAQQGVTDRLLARWQRALGAKLLERVRVLERMERPQYLSVVAAADVMLDTFYYSGGVNTVYDAVAVGTPIVTLPGEFQRGRWAAAALKHLKVEDTLATNPDDYLRLTRELASDRERRDELSRRVLAAAPLLFSDTKTVEEHDAFFAAAIERARN